MSERIPIDPRSPAEFFAIAAFTKAELSGIEIPLTKGYVDVELKINGVEVPFAVTIEDLFQRWESMVNERAVELVKEKIDLSGLVNLIEKYEREIDQKLRQMFNLPEFD